MVLNMISSVIADDEPEYLKSVEMMHKLFEKYEINADLDNST